MIHYFLLVELTDVTKQNSLLMEKLKEMVDCKTSLIQSEQRVRVLEDQ